MCDCAHTILDVLNIVNKIRSKKNLSALPYSYVLKGWHDLIDNYNGKRNPYWSDRKVGSSYVFSKFKANKIAKKLATMKYSGRSNSFGYQYWWKAA